MGKFHVRNLGVKGRRHFHWHQIKFWQPELRAPYRALSGAYDIILQEDPQLTPSETLEGARITVIRALGIQLQLDLDLTLIIGRNGCKVPKVVGLARVLGRQNWRSFLSPRGIVSRASNCLNPGFRGFDIQPYSPL